MDRRAPVADPRDSPGPTPPLTLSTPAKFLKGVGPVRAEALKRLGVFTAGELLFHIPHRYEDASTIKPIASIETGMDATIIGRVISKGVLPTRKGLRIFQAVVKDETGMIEVSWPGQPFLDRSIAKGDVLLLTGTVRFFHGRQLQPREFINLGDDDEGTGKGRVLAVYPATEGLSFKVIRGLIDAHLDGLLALVEEYLPAEVLRFAARVFASENVCRTKSKSYGCSTCSPGPHWLRGLRTKSPPYTWIAPVSRSSGLCTEWMASSPSTTTCPGSSVRSLVSTMRVASSGSRRKNRLSSRPA